MKPGDLVRYIKNTKSSLSKVLPDQTQPIGVIVDIQKTHVGSPDELGAIMTVVYVRWSDNSWNNDRGLSEECLHDLSLVQEV
jgi:hypothetical protein